MESVSDEKYLETSANKSSSWCSWRSDDLYISLLAILRAGYTLLPVSGVMRAVLEIVEQLVLFCRERAQPGLVILRRLGRRSIFGTRDHHCQRTISLFVVHWHYNDLNH